MRGYVLSNASVLEALRPYVITHWNGNKTGEMPAVIREICAKADPKEYHSPILFFVHDREGRLLKILAPQGGEIRQARIELDRMHEYLLEELGKLSTSGVKLSKVELHLPDAASGVRIYLKLKPRNRPVLNYSAPVVEAVPTTEGERSALAYGEKKVDASKLRWLEQIYPPSIMDKTGKVTKVAGTLTLKPAGQRQAILSGEVEMTLDDNAKTVYRGTLELVLTYGEGDAYTSFRGVYAGMYPKADKRDGKIEFDMVAAIESRPE